MNALSKKLIRDVWHLRGQAAAIALVVACGVASFVAMRSSYKSLSVTQDAYYTSYRFANVFANLKRAPESLSSRIAEIPGVAAVQTRVVAQVTLDVPNLKEPAQGKLISIPERQTAMLNDLHILRGRYVEHGRSDEILISGAFADANNLRPGDTLNAIINGRWKKLRIVGIALSPEYVYEIRGGDIFPDNKHFGVLWMNRKAVESAFQMEGAFNDVTLMLAPRTNEAAVIERLDNLMERYGGLGAFGRSEQTSHRFLENELGELSVYETFIPAIFLGVTAFLLHLVLSRLVNTQRDQIAVMKAFGYSNTDIGFHYLKLAFIAITGGIILGLIVGIRFGLGMTNLYSEFFRFPVLRYVLELQTIAWAFIFSFGAAGIGALAAVRKAVLLPPAEAMRPEPPPNFRASLFERTGLQKIFSPSIRIIIRNLERKPIKAGLTSLGIAMAVSLLFVGFYFFDAINRIIAVQFNYIAREDVIVTFNEPLMGNARFDLMNMPGVMRVETFRAVAARIRFEHRSRRVGIMGLEHGSDLRRIVNSDFRVIELPEEGIVLSQTLAEILKVKEGDELTVEVMEGAQPVWRMKIVSVVEELVGLGVYMDIRALNKLMREENTISGALMMVDSTHTAKLYSELKETPAVASVGLPGTALQSFNDTMARTIGTSTTILILFASTIAFGVVYNGARIALSERGRELASLRVLGFTKREVMVMLLGEQAVLTLIAIPLGFVIGFLLCTLITMTINKEIIRLPLVFSTRTFILAFFIVAFAALLSGLLVRRRLGRLDLIQVLKTRE